MLIMEKTLKWKKDIVSELSNNLLQSLSTQRILTLQPLYIWFKCSSLTEKAERLTSVNRDALRDLSIKYH